MSAVTCSKRHAVDLAGHAGVDVLVALEGLAEPLVGRVMGQHPQFDLRVVGRHQRPALLAGHEGRADLAAGLGPHGNVLQVGIVRAQPPGGRDHLVERGMHAAGPRIDHLRQGVDIRPLQLGVLPILDDLRRQGMLQGQLLQHVDVGAGARLGRPLDHRQLLLDEEHLLELPRRGDVELAAGQGIDLLLQSLHLLAEVAAQFGQTPDVDLHAVVFQLDQHVDQRHLHVAKQRHQALLFQPPREDRLQADRHQGIFGRIVGDLRHGHLVHPLLLLARSDQLFDLDRDMCR